jgi:hypothetical protein
MRALILPLALLLSLAACTSSETEELVVPQCSTPATVRNLAGLDGCGFVLELSNGQRLEPRGDRWAQFPKVDGRRVTVTYRDASGVSACMAGKIVELDCIAPVSGE